MREILFRGKRIDNGEWEYGQLHSIHKGGRNYETAYYILNIYGERRLAKDQLDTTTIGQYIGLKDKNGNKIFENDIVKWGHFNTIERPIRIAKVEMKPDIRFNSNVGVFQYGEFAYQDTENYLEVIGNKFDNPEL